MKKAWFINIDVVPFIGYWNGKPKTFKAGEQMLMQEWLARHFAKYLTNKLLLDKNEETSTSPKKPDEVPKFAALFNRCFKLDSATEATDEAYAEAEIINGNANPRKGEPSMNIDPPVRDPKAPVKPSPKVDSPDAHIADQPPTDVTDPDDAADENDEFPELKEDNA
jgi:hypothetical protein